MVQYFFDTRDGGQLIRDDIGMDLPDREAARQTALGALPDMVRDGLPDGDHRVFYVNIRDQNGQAIYAACMSLVGRWLD